MRPWMPWSSRCLPQPSGSTVATIFMLSKWAFAPAARGGFKSLQDSRAAESLLSAMVNIGIGGSQQLSWALVFENDWKCLWPRPSVVYKGEKPGHVTLEFHKPDGLDMGPMFCDGLTAQSAAVQQRWVKALMKAGIGPAPPVRPVVALLKVLAATTELASCFAQVVLHLAWLLEGVLVAASKPDSSVDDVSFGFRSTTPSPGDLNMDEKLYEYLMAGVQASEAHVIVSVPTDKASTSFLSMQNTVLVFASNVGVLCCPQVA